MLLRPLSMSMKVLLPVRYTTLDNISLGCYWPDAPVRGTAARGMPMQLPACARYQLLLALVTCSVSPAPDGPITAMSSWECNSPETFCTTTAPL